MIPLALAEASRLIAGRKLSPVELTRACLDRIEALNPAIAAFVTVTPERALADARAAEERIMRSGPKSPLDGVPIAHKDMIETAGILTTAQSRLLAANVPARDATVVRRLAEAGATMLGKLATLEFALAGPSFDLPWPPARNPWNLDHFTAGSSSGTGAAIAAGMILGGTGTDTGGSIRGPSGLCGVSGVKPTFGRCSRAGVIPLAHSLDHVGPMAWTAEDCALLLQQMAGHDPADPHSADVPVPDFSERIGASLRGLRVGVVSHFHETDFPVSAATAAAIGEGLRLLREAGATIEEARLSPLTQYSAANRIIMNAEAAAYHEDNVRHRLDGFGERMRCRMLLASLLPATDYIKAQRRRAELCREFAGVMRRFDVLVTATANDEAPRLADIPFWDGLEKPGFALPWNLTGYPSIAVRMGFGPKGLPLSMQIGGRPFEEATLFQVADRLERATPWREMRPAL